MNFENHCDNIEESKSELRSQKEFILGEREKLIKGKLTKIPTILRLNYMFRRR
jgi:hypothetical protein